MRRCRGRAPAGRPARSGSGGDHEVAPGDPFVRVELGDGPGEDDAPPVDDVDAVRGFRGRDGAAARKSSIETPSDLRRPMASTTAWATSGARPSCGSSSRSRRGFVRSERAMLSICCWPPLRFPASRPRNSASGGNSASTRADVPVAVGGEGAGYGQVLGHREVGEHAPVFRHVADPPPHHLVRGAPGQVLAAEPYPPPDHRDEVLDDAPQGARLARPVAATMQTTSPSSTARSTPCRASAWP